MKSWLFNGSVIAAVVLGVGVVCAAAGISGPVDFYVAPWGDDNAPGTFEAPFATVERSRDAIRALKQAVQTGSFRVEIRGGVYRIEQPIVFGVEDSGTATQSITYAAYADEVPVISGGRAIVNWEQKGSVWTTTVPGVSEGEWTFRELFVGGARAVRARHPNVGFARVQSAAPDQRTTFQFYDGDLPTMTQLQNAELAFMHDWSISRVRIDHADHVERVLVTAEPIGGVPSFFGILGFEDHPRYYVENDAALVDAPGEWYLDKASGELTYFAHEFEDPNVVGAVAPIATELLVVRGDFATNTFVENLRFMGIAFEHCAWSLPSGGYAEYQAGFYEWRDLSEPYALPSAITLELADRCRFENGRIAHLGGWGIMMGRSCRSCALVGTLVTDVAGNAVMVGEDRYRVFNGAQWWILHGEQAASDNIISNNLIERCGTVLHGCVAVWVGLANGTTISHNVVRNTPQTGISVGGMWNDDPTPCFGNVIEDNHIHDVMQTLSDGAGIYTVGLQPGTVMRRNLIHSVPPNVGLSDSNGLYCDEGSTGMVLDGNGIFGVIKSPIRFHRAGANDVVNNTIVMYHALYPPIRYQNTSALLIHVENNNTTISPELVECGDPVYQAVPNAGLEEPYRTRLLGAPAGAPCGSCDGVPYSGLAIDECGECGDGWSCNFGIPTVSQWGTIVMSMLFMIAGTICWRRMGRADRV